jgi:DNA (cytosine-5)-methyltransferase 1
VVVGGLDHWKLAADTFRLNFPNADVINNEAEVPDPFDIKSRVGPIDLLLASPECTSHSVAKGNAPRCESSRATAFQVIRFAKVFEPRWIVIENVTRMRTWARYEEWKMAIEALGYHTNVCVLDSQDYRTPQARRRLFVLCDRKAKPTPPPKARGPKPQIECVLGWNQPRGKPWTFRPIRRGVQAAATLERAKRAIEAFGPNSEFIIVYYGSDGAGGYQSVSRPLRTVTTLDRFAFVRPTPHGHEMRMLQPPELAAAMGFPPNHKWPRVSRRDRIKLIGNAVCPPVMCAVVRHLTQLSPLPAAKQIPERALRRPAVALMG